MRVSVLVFLAGILFVQQLPELPSLHWGGLLVPALFLARRWPRTGLPLVFLLAGILWASLRACLVLNESLPQYLEGRDLVIAGRIADLPAVGEHGARFQFDIETARLDAQPVRVPGRVLLSFYNNAPDLVVGDRWTFTVRLRRPHGYQNPGGFDYEAHLFERRIRATGYVRERESRRRLAGLDDEAGFASPGYRLNRLRQKLSARIQSLLPQQAFAGMITALANGDDTAVPAAHWDVLSRTGTIHLVAISGMNIGLIAGIVYVLVRRLWSLPAVTALLAPAPRVAAVAAFLAAAGYAALAGFAIPTQRALAMLAVVLVGSLLGRRTAPSTLLIVALFVVLMIDPLSVLAAGFWLSFAAVAVILYTIDNGGPSGWKKRLRQWGRVQWAISIGLLPLLILLFQQASLAAPLANLAAIPVIEIVTIPATLLGAGMSLVFPDSWAVWPLRLAAVSLEWLWPLLEFLARLPGALWTQHAPVSWTLIPAAIGIALLLAPSGFPARWLGALWLLPLFLVRPETPKPGEVWFTLLDVGQGLSAVVRTREHTLVYDTGPWSSSRFDAGRSVVVPFLRHEDRRHVDTLVVSHGDNDHIGGSRSLLAALPVGRILTSVPDRFAAAEPCQGGQHWQWDGVRFEMLHPRSADPLTGNNRSCVLRVAGRFGRVLLPGDIATRAERILIAEWNERLPADVLVAPHHGSKSSSSEGFIEAVHPRLVLFATGYRNRHHHPHPVVMDRYLRRKVLTADSPGSGAITVKLDASGMRAEHYRATHRRYWYAE